MRERGGLATVLTDPTWAGGDYSRQGTAAPPYEVGEP